MKVDIMKIKQTYFNRINETKKELKQLDISNIPLKEIPMVTDVSLIAVISNLNRGF